MPVNQNEAPKGHTAVPFDWTKPRACDECSMLRGGYCHVKDPHSCCAMDRKDREDVVFKQISTK